MRDRRRAEPRGVVLCDESGVEITGGEARMREQRRLERDIARDAADHETVERLTHARDRLVTVPTVHDELGDHRVIVHGDLAALVDAGIDAYAATRRHRLRGFHVLRRRPVLHQAAGRGQEVAERIFGVDAALDRPTFALDVLLLERELLAGCDADHLLHEVEPGDALGDRMLHLQTRVHLEEEERFVFPDHELDGACTLVIDRLGERDRLLAHRFADLIVEEGARRLFDHLLVTALDRALPLPEIETVAVRVAQHLDLDVARLLDKFLDKHAVVAEAVARFVATGTEALEGLLVVPCDAQTFAASARARLDHHRVADIPRDLDRALRRLDRIVPAGDGAHTRLGGERFRGDLVAHRSDRSMLRPDEDDPGLLDAPRELGVLGQEAVARMHSLGARGAAGFDDAILHQIGLARRGRADQHRLVGKLDVPGVLVRLRVDGHGLDAHASRRLDDATGDLAPVGDEYLLEHTCRSPGHRHSGMLPCLRHGSSIFLSRSTVSARHTRRRVPCGMITSSM